jgi:hypothetical protein
MPIEEVGIGRKHHREARLAGALAMIAGLALGYFLILRPLQEARAGVPELSWGGSYGFISPMLLLVGVVGIFFPGLFALMESPRIVKPSGNLTGFGVAVAFAIILPIIGLCFWVNGYVEHQFQQLGYVEGRLTAGSK